MSLDDWTTSAPGAVFDVGDVVRALEDWGKLYHQFLRVPDLRMGVYTLAAGATDPQTPHTEDEVYYVLSGRATIAIGETVNAVKTGSIIYVERHTPHTFVDIEEAITLLVFFASNTPEAAPGA